MIVLLALAQEIVDKPLKAIEIERRLLDLGFTDIEFPVRGPRVRVRYLGVVYDLG